MEISDRLRWVRGRPTPYAVRVVSGQRTYRRKSRTVFFHETYWYYRNFRIDTVAILLLLFCSDSVQFENNAPLNWELRTGLMPSSIAACTACNPGRFIKNNIGAHYPGNGAQLSISVRRFIQMFLLLPRRAVALTFNDFYTGTSEQRPCW